MSVTQTLPDISVGFTPFGNLGEKRWKEYKSQWGWKTPRKQGLLHTGLVHI